MPSTPSADLPPALTDLQAKMGGLFSRTVVSAAAACACACILACSLSLCRADLVCVCRVCCCVREVVDLTSQYSSELKQIDESIAELHARKQSQLSRKRRITRSLILYGSLSWLLLLLVLYVIEIPNRTHFVAKCLRVLPAILWPLGLFLAKTAMDSYYTIQWKKIDATLTKLEKSKETKVSRVAR